MDKLTQELNYRKGREEYFLTDSFKNRVDSMARELLNHEDYKNNNHYNIAKDAVRFICDIDIHINDHISALVRIYMKNLEEE